jgi:hypothetical protein
LLSGSKWCLVQLLGALYQAEAPTKLAMERFGVIAHHFEPAAFRRAFWAKCAHNHVATWLDSTGNLPNVSKTSLWTRKKMEYSSVMPEIVGVWFQFDFGDIADQPTHLLRSRTQSLFRDFDCGLRYIQYGEVVVSAKKKVVNER